MGACARRIAAVPTGIQASSLHAAQAGAAAWPMPSPHAPSTRIKPLAVAVEVKLPRLGQGMEAGTIVRWLKSEGDAVAKGEPLYELDTDKVTQEVEADAEGVLLKIVIADGEVDVGTTVGVIGAEGEDVSALGDGASGDGGAAAPAEGREVEESQPETRPRRRRRRRPPRASRPRSRARRPPPPSRLPASASRRARLRAESPASAASTSPRSPGRVPRGESSPRTSNGQRKARPHRLRRRRRPPRRGRLPPERSRSSS